MPSEDLVTQFIEDTRNRCEKIETKVDRLTVLAWIVFGAAMGGNKLIPLLFEIAKATAGF